MKYLLYSSLFVATALYFGALPAFVPGQPGHRTAQIRRHRWAPASWGVRWGGLGSVQRKATAVASYRKAGAHAGRWVDYAECAGSALARGAFAHVKGTIVSFYKQALTAATSTSLPIDDPSRAGEAYSFDLAALNREYADLLTRHRRRASPSAPQVQYDAILFQGCHDFNRVLEGGDSLYHSPTQPRAELVGMSTELGAMRTNPRGLAQYILTKFEQSPHHAVIQARSDLNWVAVSVTDRFFVVRLNNRPTE